MSRVSSVTGLSSTSSFNAFHRGAWCTLPRSFLEEQESTSRRNVRAMKISPWTLARLNAEEVSKAAAQARRKSKVLQPIVRWTNPMGQETESSMRVAAAGWCSSLISAAELTTDNGTDMASETSTSLAPLQLEARNAFGSNMPRSSARIAAAPNSGLGSPGLHPSDQSSLRAEELQELSSLSTLDAVATKGGSDLRINR